MKNERDNWAVHFWLLCSYNHFVKYDPKRLVRIAARIQESKPLNPFEIDYLLDFRQGEKEVTLLRKLKKLAVPLSLLFGFFFTVFPERFEQFSMSLPYWTNFSPPLLAGINYFWDLIGDPVKKANVIYHIPNIILYSFGILGVKKLFDLLNKKTWLDRVFNAQKIIQDKVQSGQLDLRMKKGHSLLFVGRGDFIGMQNTLNCGEDETVTVADVKPNYTDIWNYYSVDTLYEDLKDVLVRSDGENAGEYIFFPVKDDQIFLPGLNDFDLSPHKLDILVSNIRVIERELKWKAKRIIIIGDRFHQSFVRSEDSRHAIPKSEDLISLSTIASKYNKVTLIDPTDIVLKRILEIAAGRKIVFRATLSGIKEYKQRFYTRLKLLGHTEAAKKKGVLTIGYDIFEDQTEQQTLSRKIDDYYPVVLSKNVCDALIRNGYKKSEFLYVPELVLMTLMKTASEQ